MKAEDDPKVYCFIVIRDATTQAKHIDSYCGAAEYGKALVEEEIVGIMHPLSDFLEALKPNGCQEKVIFHLLQAPARSRNILSAITIATGRISITAGCYH